MANQKRMHAGHMMHAIHDKKVSGMSETRKSPGAVERDVPRVNPGAAGGVGATAPKDHVSPPTPQPRPGGSAPKGSAKL